VDVAIVRRGRWQIFFDFFHLQTSERPIQVIWDRRYRERRRSADAATRERRQGDRRTAPPSTWQDRHYILIDTEPSNG
jgi:hypothetical protein